MSWKTGFYEALAEFVRSKGYGVLEVTDFEQESNEVGGCDTCSFTEITVEIYYTDSKSKNRIYTYYGGMADLIRELTD